MHPAARAGVLAAAVLAASGPAFAGGSGILRVYVEDSDGKPVSLKEVRAAATLTIEGGGTKELSLTAKTPARATSASRRHGGETRTEGKRTVEFVVSEDPADPKDTPHLEAALPLSADARFTADLTLDFPDGKLTLKGFRHPPAPPADYKEAVSRAGDALETVHSLIEDGRLPAVPRFTARTRELCDAASKLIQGKKTKAAQGECRALSRLTQKIEDAAKGGKKEPALQLYFEAAEHLDVLKQYGEP